MIMTWKKLSEKSLGYTLLEMLLVLVLLSGAGFYLLLQLPRDYQEKNMEISSTALLQDLRETQQAAIAGNVWYKVKFYPSSNEYRIFKQGEVVSLTVLQEGVNFVNSPGEITFLPSGTPDRGMSVVLKAGSLEEKVIISPVMGRVRIESVGN